MFRSLDRVTDSSFAPAVTLNWKRDESLAGPYRRVRTFRAPPREYDVTEGNERGMVFANTEGKLYFADVETVWYPEPGKHEYYIRELGFKEMSGLPSQGARNQVNPNEFEEAKAFFIGEAPDDVKNDLRALLENPKEWPQRRPTLAPVLQ